MAIDTAAAIAAYRAATRTGAQGAPGSIPDEAASAAGMQNFGAFLDQAVKDAMSTMRAGEAAATDGAAGKGDIVQVVNAVTAAELTLETVVAVRDRVIAAYQDIMKMPI